MRLSIVDRWLNGSACVITPSQYADDMTQHTMIDATKDTEASHHNVKAVG